MRDTTQNLNNQQSIPIRSIEIDTVMKLSIQNNHPYVINAGRLPRLTKIKQLMKAYKDNSIIIPTYTCIRTGVVYHAFAT